MDRELITFTAVRMRDFKPIRTSKERWVYKEYYCPNCGKQSVWMDDTGGDFYVGEKYFCLACDHKFHLPIGTMLIRDDYDKNVLDAIKTLAKKQGNDNG